MRPWQPSPGCRAGNPHTIYTFPWQIINCHSCNTLWNIAWNVMLSCYAYHRHFWNSSKSHIFNEPIWHQGNNPIECNCVYCLSQCCHDADHTQFSVRFPMLFVELPRQSVRKLWWYEIFGMSAGHSYIFYGKCGLVQGNTHTNTNYIYIYSSNRQALCLTDVWFPPQLTGWSTNRRQCYTQTRSEQYLLSINEAW